MKPDLFAMGLQTALLLALAPLITGCIRNWKARLQNRRGPRVWQPYFDLLKFLRKDMVISEHASWVFSAAPYVVFITALLVGLMVPMVTVSGAVEPVRRRAGGRRFAGARTVFHGAWADSIRPARSAAWAAAAK